MLWKHILKHDQIVKINQVADYNEYIVYSL